MKRIEDPSSRPLIDSDFWNVVSKIKIGGYVSFAVKKDVKKIDALSSWTSFKTEPIFARHPAIKHCYLKSRGRNVITGKTLLKFGFSSTSEIWISEPIHEGTDFDFFTVRQYFSRTFTWYVPCDTERRCVRSDDELKSTFRIEVEKDDPFDKNRATEWCLNRRGEVGSNLHATMKCLENNDDE